ncbi:MAG: hypothetical protein K9M07_07745 [Simkaniaceae bacterium]|nr:hypothetical protein [Simkaniaceae bacterium]
MQSRAISENDLGTAVINAANKGYLDVIRYLLSNGRTISNRERRREIILEASRGGYADILEFLFQSCEWTVDSALRASVISRASGPEAGRIRDMIRMARVEELSLATEVLPGTFSSRNGTFYCTFDDVRANPLAYLNTILEQGFPERIYLIDSPRAVDLGGVTKQFITTLMESLVSKRAIPLGDTKVPTISVEDDKIILANLGRFYSLLAEKNQERTDRFVTGSLFSPKFFEMVLALHEAADDDAKERSIAEILASIDPTFKPLRDIILDPSEEHQSAYAAAMGCTNEEALEDAKGYPATYVEAAEAFLCGINTQLRELLISNGTEVFSTTLQGLPVSKEALLGAIQTEGDVDPIKFDWLKEAINSSDDEWRVKFVRVITGNALLSPGLKIKVRPSSENLFEIHTCYNSLHLPIITMSKEEFLAALDAALSDQRYNTA